MQDLLALAWIASVGWPVLLALGLATRRIKGIVAFTFLGASSVFWALGVWAFLIEPQLLVVRHATVESAAWTSAPLRIGVISDTHIGAPHMSRARLDRIVARMNAQAPDVVLLAGDYAGRHEPAALRASPDRSVVLEGLQPFSNLTAPLGVYAVLGNHDWAFDGAAIEAELSANGVDVLENRAVRIDRAQGEFWITGLADVESRRTAPSYDHALNGVPEGAAVLALSHWPDVFSDAPNGVAVTVAGHSHCGQVNLPIFGRLLHASRGSRRWPCGFYAGDNSALYVTGGVGVSIFPVRFRQPPEIVILTLRAAEP